MEKYTVTGMSCAACQARVEKAVNSVEGVTSCSVSLLTNSMGVEGSASKEAVIDAVVAAGYNAFLQEKTGSEGNSPGYDKQSALAESLIDRETPVLRNRFISSCAFVLVLMYFSIGHMMWGWPLPKFFDGNHVAMGLIQLLLATIVMVINQKFFINGFKGLIHKNPNMDTLVALGSMSSYVWSVYVLFAMTRAQADGNTALVEKYMMDFYFESAAMILALITLGKMLEARSKGKTTNALKSLMNLSPKTAVILRDGEEKTVKIEEVKKGDTFVVKAGDSIPVDGIIIEGDAAIDESALTGESIPVDKIKGDKVSAATINRSGYIICEATRVGEDTTLSQIIQMVSDAAATKAPIAKIADRVSGVFVPVVISIAVVTLLVWIAVGSDLGYALARAISVLVISCPCALGLATPVAIMVGNGVGAKNGILFKTSASLEETGRIRIIALDKTGTITKGESKVTDIIPAKDVSEKDLLQYAYSLEKKSEHPLAKAVNDYAKEQSINSFETESFTVASGNGLTAIIDGKKIVGGNASYISKYAKLDEDVINTIDTLSSEGKTPLIFAMDDKFIGIIAVADVLKEDSKEAIKLLKKMGIYTVMLTGDNEKTANAIGMEAGVDEVVAGVLPSGKESVISKLKEYGKVAMVGDGINDAPALTKADTGIAIGAGTDVAIDAADVVVMKSNPADVAAAVRLSRQTLRNIHENLFWAFFYNVIGIPLAAGCYVKLFGWSMNPMFGALAMSLSSFCVVTNALRLNLFDIYNQKKYREEKKLFSKEVPIEGPLIIKETTKGEMKMARVFEVEGMMCPHCEANVKQAVEAMAAGVEATADHDAGTVTVTGADEISVDEIKSIIEGKGYKFIGEK